MEQIKGYSNYIIDENGNVYSKLKHRMLKLHNNNGYLMVYLKYDNGISKWQYVHRLVARQFIPIPDKQGELRVNHKDGNKANNNVHNLEWTTISENIRHAIKTGLKKITRGEAHHRHGKQNKGKWLYCLPTGEQLRYFELKQLSNCNSIVIKCWKNIDGYSRKLLQ